MTSISVHQLKDSLSQVLASVEAGESVEVTRYGKPIAVINAVGVPTRPFNVARGSVVVGDAEFSEADLDEMLNGSVFPE